MQPATINYPLKLKEYKYKLRNLKYAQRAADNRKAQEC